MRILTVDDEVLMLDALTDCVRQAAPEAEVYAFRRGSEALSFAQEKPIDVAFLDIRMRGMDGLELGRKLLELYPEVNLIYCTSYNEYVSEAFRDIRCNGYITKPVELEAVLQELGHLRVPVKASVETEIRVRFQCLGRFEAFIDDEPIEFASTKTKELLAYLVHACGGVCTNQEIIAALWEDDNRHDSYFKKIRKDLTVTLSHHGCASVLVQHRGGIGINLKEVDCDYYRWREQHAGIMPEEYMTQYTWANFPYSEW